MGHLVALDKSAHRYLRIDGRQVERAAAGLNMAPVVLSEFLKLVVQYPIAFTKDRDTGRFACVALFGLHDQENLFVGDEGWDALYVPLQVARQPFFLGQADEPGAGCVVCVDVEHPGIVADGGDSVFDADGNATAYLEAVKQGLAQLLDGEEATAQFAATLARMKLLVPMQLEITFENGDRTQVAGLYTIDEARLAALDAGEVASLHEQGLLAPIYTMLASLGHIYGLIERRNQRMARPA